MAEQSLTAVGIPNFRGGWRDVMRITVPSGWFGMARRTGPEFRTVCPKVCGHRLQTQECTGRPTKAQVHSDRA